MKQGLIVIDGPAGVGKTTLVREVAKVLDLPYMDTGAMFRALALKLGPGAEKLSGDELARAASQWHFSMSGTGAGTKMFVNGQPLGEEIRSEEISARASALAKIPAIRSILLKAQQALGEAGSLVAEGRDLGTVVFPQAKFKFFLDARPEIRAKRRFDEIKAKGKNANLEEIAEAIRKRDEQDRNRAIAPLKPAEEAIIIDTSDIGIKDVLAKILNYIKGKQ